MSIKNVVFIFDEGVALKINDPSIHVSSQSSTETERFYRSKHKINAEIDGCIIVNAQLDFSNLLCVRIENSSFISHGKKDFSLLTINDSGKYKTSFDSIKNEQWAPSVENKNFLSEKGFCFLSNLNFEIGDSVLIDINRSSILIDGCYFNDCSGLPIENPPIQKEINGFFDVISSIANAFVGELSWINPGENHIRIQKCDFKKFERNKKKIIRRADEVIDCTFWELDSIALSEQ